MRVFAADGKVIFPSNAYKYSTYVWKSTMMSFIHVSGWPAHEPDSNCAQVQCNCAGSITLCLRSYLNCPDAERLLHDSHRQERAICHT